MTADKPRVSLSFDNGPKYGLTRSDGSVLTLTVDECVAIHRQIQHEENIGYVFDMLRQLGIDPGKKWSLGAYVRAYEQCEENSDVWIRDDDLEFYGDKFSDEQEMAYYAEQSDETDETTSLFGDIMGNVR